MKADSAILRQKLNSMCFEAVVDAAVGYYEKYCELRAEMDETDQMYGYTASELMKYKADYEEVSALAVSLQQENVRLQNQTDELRKNRFGRKSEKMDGKTRGDEFGDPLLEEMDDGDALSNDREADSDALSDDREDDSDASPKTRKTRRPACRQVSKEKKIREMQKIVIYDYSVEDLNRKYGAGKWTCKSWNVSEEVRFLPSSLYRVLVKRPVIRVYDSDDSNDFREVAVPVNKLMLRSEVTPSLLAFIMAFKFVLGVPLARLSRTLSYRGIFMSRGKMSDWIIKCTDRYLKPVYSELMRQMAQRKYTQIDETYLEVIMDGRKAGSKSYIWCHVTSEFEKVRPIVLFCFELTRSADHLLEFYAELKDYVIHLTSDAYSAYEKLATAKEGLVILGGCFMHLRRRLLKAYDVKLNAVRDEKLLEDTPERRCLDIIGKLYKADDDAKDLSAEERAAVRTETEKPLVDEYFDYIRTLDISDGTFSEEMEDAVSYSLNHESAFRVFLDDPMVPIDNGECERKIRNISLIRNNSLFCYSVGGAETLCIIQTLVETAKSNGCDPQTYLEYLLETSLRHADDDISEYVSEMMPWSAEYREFEEERFSRPLGEMPVLCTEEPDTPRKSDVDEARAERRRIMTENMNNTAFRPAA